jgi:hypothetical protein
MTNYQPAQDVKAAGFVASRNGRYELKGSTMSGTGSACRVLGLDALVMAVNNHAVGLRPYPIVLFGCQLVSNARL